MPAALIRSTSNAVEDVIFLPSFSAYRNGSGTSTGTSCRISGEDSVLAKIRTAGTAWDPMCDRPAGRRLWIDWAFVEQEFERAMALLARYEHGLRDLMPQNAEIFDAHVHLGHDIDGQIGVYEELER